MYISSHNDNFMNKKIDKPYEDRFDYTVYEMLVSEMNAEISRQNKRIEAFKLVEEMNNQMIDALIEANRRLQAELEKGIDPNDRCYRSKPGRVPVRKSSRHKE